MTLVEQAQGSSNETCQAAFDGKERNPKLADLIEIAHPKCACELYRVSNLSPGPVGNEERLHRIITTPRDADEDGNLLATPFETAAKNGLSVLRSIATAQDVEDQVVDGMHSKKGDPIPVVLALIQAEVGAVRAMQSEGGERWFAVYDQTVPRWEKGKPPVPTHAGVFTRYPPPGTADRKAIQKDLARELRDLFSQTPIPIANLHGGLLTSLNARAKAGEFLVEADASSATL